MRNALLLLGVLTLAACGANGEPEPPKVSATQTVGINSATGPYSKTSIGIQFGG